MTIQPNGTSAKDVALHFINVTTGRATPSIVAKTINQAKILLSSGYTKEEIIKVIDYVIDVKKIEMYSLGYVNTCINTILKEITSEENKIKAKEVKQQIKESFTQETQGNEVTDDGKSSERNRNKSEQFGVQSRFGEKFNLDMFKGQR